MQNDQTTQDARKLLVALSSNHAEARMATRLLGWTDRFPRAGLMRRPQAVDREGRQLHGARVIIEPEWRL